MDLRFCQFLLFQPTIPKAYDYLTGLTASMQAQSFRQPTAPCEANFTYNLNTTILIPCSISLKERAATEKDYAKQLRKSIESTVLMKSIDKEGGTLGSAITQQLSALESLAAAHEALSNALSTNLEPRLKEHLQSCDERRKKQQSAAEASWKTKQTGQTVLQSATEKYRKEANSISSYSAQLTIVAPRELSRIQANLDKCQRGLSRTVEEYKAALKNYKHACSNFEYDYKVCLVASLCRHELNVVHTDVL